MNTDWEQGPLLLSYIVCVLQPITLNCRAPVPKKSTVNQLFGDMWEFCCNIISKIYHHLCNFSSSIWRRQKQPGHVSLWERDDAILFCSPTLVKNVCCIYEWDNCHHADVEYDVVVGSQISASALCCSGVFGSRSLPPTPSPQTHTHACGQQRFVVSPITSGSA